jgi:hypothetical protein
VTLSEAAERPLSDLIALHGFAVATLPAKA